MKVKSLLQADHLGLLKALNEGSLDKVPSKAIVHGNPDRVEVHASYLREPRLVAKKRGFVSYLGYYNDEPILITSSGMGAGSASIAFEELVELGVKVILRVGTCGAYRDYIKPGDLIVSTDALLESPALRYIFPDYLRRRNYTGNIDWLYIKDDFLFVKGFEDIYTLIGKSLEEVLNGAAFKWRYNHQYYTGSVHDKDILHAWRSTYNLNPLEMEEMKAKVQKYTISTDMETGSLLTIARIRGVRAGSILVVVDFHADSETLKKQDEAMHVAYIASLNTIVKLR
ncbi:MAG: hypothetical protein QXK88_03980 [Desulfurococcaceae archaeon]